MKTLSPNEKLKIIFCGSPDIALPCLYYLTQKSNIEILWVISNPDRPKGRGKKLTSSPVAQFAKDNALPLFQPEKINDANDFLDTLESDPPNLIIVFAYGQFLNKRILNLPTIGCFNIHTSLLPKYRGAAPIQYAILNGDKKTGISIQKMVSKMDAGDIATSLEIDILDNETSTSLYEKLKLLAPRALDSFFNDLLNNNLELKPQNDSHISFAPTLQKADGLFNFKNLTTLEAKRKLKALDSWPSLYLFQGNKLLKVFILEDDPTSVECGKSLAKDGRLLIGLKDGTLRIKELQLEGRKRCKDFELLNGLKEKINLQTTRS